MKRKSFGNHLKRQKYYIWGGTLLALIILIGFACNTVLFHKKLNGVVEKYLSDNNQHQANHISMQIMAGYEGLEEFADSLEHMPEFVLTEELLERKAEVLGFEQMAVISADKEIPIVVGKRGEELVQWLQENPQIWEKPSFFLPDEQKVLFSVPIRKQGQIEQVVAGVRSSEELHAPGEPSIGWEKGVTVLIDICSCSSRTSGPR